MRSLEARLGLDSRAMSAKTRALARCVERSRYAAALMVPSRSIRRIGHCVVGMSEEARRQATLASLISHSRRLPWDNYATGWPRI